MSRSNGRNAAERYLRTVCNSKLLLYLQLRGSLPSEKRDLKDSFLNLESESLRKSCTRPSVDQVIFCKNLISVFDNKKTVFDRASGSSFSLFEEFCNFAIPSLFGFFTNHILIRRYCDIINSLIDLNFDEACIDLLVLVFFRSSYMFFSKTMSMLLDVLSKYEYENNIPSLEDTYGKLVTILRVTVFYLTEYHKELLIKKTSFNNMLTVALTEHFAFKSEHVFLSEAAMSFLGEFIEYLKERSLNFLEFINDVNEFHINANFNENVPLVFSPDEIELLKIFLGFVSEHNSYILCYHYISLDEINKHLKSYSSVFEYDYLGDFRDDLDKYYNKKCIDLYNEFLDCELYYCSGKIDININGFYANKFFLECAKLNYKRPNTLDEDELQIVHRNRQILDPLCKEYECLFDNLSEVLLNISNQNGLFMLTLSDFYQRYKLISSRATDMLKFFVIRGFPVFEITRSGTFDPNEHELINGIYELHVFFTQEYT